MSVNYLERKSGISLVIAVVLAVSIFVLSFKFSDYNILKYEFLCFFFLELFILFYSINGKYKKVNLVIWPILVGIFYAMFNGFYPVVFLNRTFTLFILLIDVSAVLSSSLFYLLFILHRKNNLWKGGNNGVHKKEVIEIIQEKNNEENIKEKEETIREIVKEKKKKVLEKSKKIASKEIGKKKKSIAEIIEKGEDEEDSKNEGESYFNLNNDNDLRKDKIEEVDLSEEVSEILDSFENEDDLEEKKEDLSEGVSIDFEKDAEEEY